MHVLSLPPAFVLSQDQTLRFDKSSSRLVTVSKHRREKRPKHRPARKPTSAHDRQTLQPKSERVHSHLNETCLVGLFSRTSLRWKGNTTQSASSANTAVHVSLSSNTLQFSKITADEPPSVDPQVNLAKHPTDTSKLLTPGGAKTSRPALPPRKPENQTVSFTAKQTSLPGRLVRPTAPGPSLMSGL